MADTRLTEKKQKFIEAYWEAVENGIKEKEALKMAKIEAGYADNVSIPSIVRTLGDDILTHANIELKLALPKAVKSLKSILEDPEQKGASNAIAASASVLDRAGVVKKESHQVNVTMPSGIAFMPPKIPVDIENAETPNTEHTENA